MSKANVNKFRRLSPQFMQDLQDKERLLSLKSMIKNDNSLSLEIRNNYINIYYRGGNLLKLSEVKEHTYKPFFEIKYADEKDTFLNRLPTAISSSEDLNRWLENFPLLKSIMDSWFLKHPKLEREFQQMVIWENNNSSIASATDYFIADIEYAKTKVGRFDMIAIQWDSDASARTLQHGYSPRLCFIEMKYGGSALRGKCGMLEHAKQWSKYLLQDENKKYIKDEMLKLFQQKRNLDLIAGLKDNHNVIERLSDEMDCIFLLANHDPRNRKIKKIIEELKESKEIKEIKESGIAIKFCVINSTDYGLYKANVIDIDEF